MRKTVFSFIYAEKIMNEPSSLMTPNIYKTNLTKSELKHSFDRGDRGLVIRVLMNKSADVVKIPCSPALHKKMPSSANERSGAQLCLSIGLI